MERRRILIIGAGPTGLGAAYRLKELGENDFLVLDAANVVGGLSRSFQDAAGFTWDIGGHVQFSHYRYFDEVMQKALGSNGWYHHQREAWARMFGSWVPYPVQNNLRHFPQEVMAKCVLGLVQLYRAGAPSRTPENFRQWIDATFGPGLADVFMVPYNFKVWAYPPEQLSWNWIGERVAVTDLERVLSNIFFEKDDVSWGPNSTFQFPKEGGTGAIWSAVASLVGDKHFRLGTRVALVDTVRRVVTTATGETFGYDALISTMPLDVLLRLTQPVDESAVSAVGQLLHSTTHVVGLGLKGHVPDSLKTKCWIYLLQGGIKPTFTVGSK